MIKQSYKALGLMSGTSLDGLDLALVHFERKQNWQFKIEQAATWPYPESWLEKLHDAPTMKAENLLLLHHAFGRYLGSTARNFLAQGKHKVEAVDLLASHGHTIFHQPQQGLTFQLGAGPNLRQASGLTTVCDFRTGDLALGGQGAPLVPIGDQLLFPQYSACINLGGFSNISYQEKGQRVAYDIGPCNGLLNHLSEKLGKPYDAEGSWAREGKIDRHLLEELQKLDHYQQKPPKSLGREWLERAVLPLFQNLPPQDGLATAVEHIANLLTSNLPVNGSKVLLTGGGAKNLYLMERLNRKAPYTHWVVPEEEMIDFKEALIFAFLGVLRLREENNVLASVTGAPYDHCSGHLLP